ncbi:hypothetical protein [Sagittula stellata]|uniref:50S ribosomal protein L19 n=1 Tax=Sagittula stellata (strain ATCC 700073 / DSM 11524 / E-37) TaxID=388399 RepID=A3KA85_SAGS3|nr:hypothetical protein [Sagittula stellata]EBA05876.1 50S ribosomal protein L19 [Sagittula stellata E-37]
MRAFCLLALLATPAAAWEHTVEYRFTGTEIAAFTVLEPEVEDPEVLELTLSSDSGTLQIVVEADNGLGDCPEILTYAQGNPGTTIVLTANLNAQTMNGVTLAQCSER